MNNKKVLISLSVVLGIMLIGLYFVVYNRDDLKPKAKEVGSELVLEPLIEYVDTELGFKINYPGDWEVKKYDSVNISYPGWRQMPEGGGTVRISTEDITLEEFIERYNSSFVSDDGTPVVSGEGKPVTRIIKQEKYTTKNISGTKLVGTTEIGLDQSFILIPRNGGSLIIEFHDYDEAHLEIIETLKLVDSQNT